jgi:hypothetical protein
MRTLKQPRAEATRERIVAAAADPFEWIVQRLDAIQEMIRQRGPCKGGCIIGNLSTALADTHEPFRKRLAKCFEEMAAEFRPCLDAAMARQTARLPEEPVDTPDLARYIVTVIEGAIMLSRTRHDRRLVAQHFDHLKRYLSQVLSA